MSVELPNGSDGVLRCESVWKLFRTADGIVKAVQNVSLNIARGKLVCLRGPSGSGKSTLLAMLAALEPPTKGEVFGLGQRYGAMNQYELGRFRRRSVGIVFQELSLIPHLMAGENIVAPLLFDGRSMRELQSIAEYLLGRVGLAHRASHYPRELSYGERQRVAIARAIVNKPKIVIADEPTANLDTANVSTIVAILKELCSQGATVVVATHDDAIERVADHVFGMADGTLS